jgi:tRNA(adenine34) deaminase
MGDHSRWNILSDTNLSAVLPEVFLPAPEIVSGPLQKKSKPSSTAGIGYIGM